MIACDPVKARALFAALEAKQKAERDGKIAMAASQKLRTAANFFAMARSAERGGVDDAPPEPESKEAEPVLDRCGNGPRASEHYEPGRAARFRAEGEQRLTTSPISTRSLALGDLGHGGARSRHAGASYPLRAPRKPSKLPRPALPHPARPWRPSLEKVYEKPVAPVYEGLRTKTPDFRDRKVSNYDEFGKVRRRPDHRHAYGGADRVARRSRSRRSASSTSRRPTASPTPTTGQRTTTPAWTGSCGRTSCRTPATSPTSREATAGTELGRCARSVSGEDVGPLRRRDHVAPERSHAGSPTTPTSSKSPGSSVACSPSA